MATEKFKALVHFIVHECLNNPEKLGAIRLNKALWYSDVISYKMNGSSITGASYVKRKKGPVPAKILSTLKELENESKILIREPEAQYDCRKFLCLVKPDTKLLSEDERTLAKTMLERVCGRSANEISEETHDVIWEAASEGEEIPLYATLAAEKGQVSAIIKSWADGIVSKLEARVA